MPDKETQIYLIRHGSVDNPNDISYGRLPIPLSDKGIQEVEELSKVLKARSVKFENVYTSPLVRAIETTRIICRELGIDDFEVKEELNDVDVGNLEGKPMQILKEANYIEENLREMGFKIEPKTEITKRVSGLIDELAQKHQGETIVLISHGDVTRLALWSQEFPEKKPPRALRDHFYLATAEAVILKFGGNRYLGHEFIRRETQAQIERDSLKRTEAY